MQEFRRAGIAGARLRRRHAISHVCADLAIAPVPIPRRRRGRFAAPGLVTELEHTHMRSDDDVEPVKLRSRLLQAGFARFAMSGHDKQVSPDVRAPSPIVVVIILDVIPGRRAYARAPE